MKKPGSVLLGQGLVLLTALIWAAFGILVALNAHPALPDMPMIKIIYAAGSILIALGLLILSFFLSRQYKWAYLLSMAVFGMTGLAVFLDDVGWIDLAFLALCIFVLSLLIKDRRWYLQNDRNEV